MNESKDSAWPSYLIDSDVLIDHLRGYQQPLDFIDLTRLDVDGESARKAGEYRARYLRSHGLALPDALVAATAFVAGADLITRNARHYPMTDVKVVEPYVLTDR